MAVVNTAQTIRADFPHCDRSTGLTRTLQPPPRILLSVILQLSLTDKLRPLQSRRELSIIPLYRCHSELTVKGTAKEHGVEEVADASLIFSVGFDEAFVAAELDLVANGRDHFDKGVHGDESFWHGKVRYSEGEEVGHEPGEFEGEAVGNHSSPFRKVSDSGESARRLMIIEACQS
jgi:hypothetical protein